MPDMEQELNAMRTRVERCALDLICTDPRKLEALGAALERLARAHAQFCEMPFHDLLDSYICVLRSKADAACRMSDTL